MKKTILLLCGMLAVACSDDDVSGQTDTGPTPDAGPPPPGELKVGVARMRMPVPLGIGTVGYAGFGLAGHPSPFVKMFAATNRIHAHPQYRAAVISRGPGHEVVFLRSDMVGMFQQFRRAVVLELNKRLGREMDHALIFGGTHTHSGPGRLIGAGGLFDMIADAFFPELYENMVGAAADTVEAAYKDLQQGRVGYVVARADEGQTDRRCEDGKTHVNGTLPLLVLQQGQKTVGLVFSYAVHGTVLSLEDLNLSREVAGAIEDAMEARFDHPVEALFFNSWGGDISPATPKVSEQSGATLRADYPELEALHTAAPELVLRHNLHGIDIDPRAAQVAALALWLRAKRAFQTAELPRTQRPAITKTNIVVAEPMPGDAELREAFIATLESKLGKLVERVFDRMSLAGEAGYLLRIAEMMEESIRQIYGGAEDMFSKQDEDRWVKAAKELNTSLETFATSDASDQAFTRQLFAGDAARGLGFIDVCSQRYDAILMNPPFGAFALGTRDWAKTAYPRTKNDIYAAFVERGIEILHPRAHLGAITSRTGFFLSSFQKWREEILLKEAPPVVVADLGYGVMDDAMVEAAAYCLEVAG